MKTLTLALMAVLLLSGCQSQRSLSSWTVEKVLTYRGKAMFDEQPQAQFDTMLANKAIENTTPVANPQTYIKSKVSESQINGMQVFVWNDTGDKNQPVILYTHGGAYINQPLKYHFKAVDNIANDLNAKVVFPIYPKLPKHTYQETYANLDKLYRELLKTHSPNNIHFMGDSAGGGLALGLALYAKDNGLPQPKNIVLLSPWLDIATNNPDIAYYEKQDPMLSAWGLNQLGQLWANGKDNMQNPYVSPLFGDLTRLGKISIFVGTHEIFLPDNQKLHEQLTKQNIAHHYTVVPKMNHVYAILPIKEAKHAQKQIVEILR